MSYRNPGDIQIADPSAFMSAFNSVIEPYKAKLEQKAEEKKKLLEKYDAANAKLTASMNYPSWVEKYGSTKAAAIKQMVEEDYIQNNRFASASLSDQQAMLDEIQTNIVQGVKNLDAAVSLDFREILPSHLDNWTSTNKEFTEFLASKPDDSNDITIERQNGELGFSYTVDGQKKFISQSKMPKGIASYKGKTAVNQELQTILDANAKDLDDKFSKAPDMTGVDSYIKSKVASVYANIKSDPAKLETIWENLQIDFNGNSQTFNVVPVENLEGGKVAFNIFPNPTSSENINLSFRGFENQEILIAILIAIRTDNNTNNEDMYEVALHPCT